VSDIISVLENIGPYLKTIALVIGVAIGLIGAAATVYMAKTTFGPLLVVLQWMFAYKPGERPNDIVAGISFGARMLVWAALISLVVWFLFQWRASS
jgi:hypothetical protein